MSLKNETYVVSTKSGDITVPVAEIVPYLNVNLIGYGALYYNKNISMSLAALADDIKDLKDNGASTAQFDFDQAKEDAIHDVRVSADEIIAELEQLAVDKVNHEMDLINEKITKNIEDISVNKNNITALDDTINNEETGLVRDITLIKSQLGTDDSTGILANTLQNSNDIQDETGMDTTVKYKHILTFSKAKFPRTNKYIKSVDMGIEYKSSSPRNDESKYGELKVRPKVKFRNLR